MSNREQCSQEIGMKTKGMKQNQIVAPKTETPAITNEPANAANGGAPEWKINGWINRTKTGKSITVSMVDDNGESVLMGFINITQLIKIVNGQITGTPIKCPPDIE